MARATTVHHRVDRAAFIAVQRAIGFEVTEGIWNQLDLVPGGMVMAHDERGPVAVACAERRSDGWVELGWVAVAPMVRGRGLGRVVCSVLVAVLLDAGHTQIFGSTQDERIVALRIYLRMGFQAVYRPEKTERWAAVLDQIDFDVP